MTPSAWRVAAWTAIAVHFLLLLCLGLSHHWAFLDSLNDLGMFDQAVWGTRHGDWFLNTNNPFGEPMNWLGFHFNAVLLAFVPLYAIAPAAEWFVLAQALALSLAAWPVFLLARHVFRAEQTALLWLLAYLANPFVLNAALWDFHPVTLAVPLIAFAMYAVAVQRVRLFVACCLLLLPVQEQMGLTVAGLGLLWGWQNGGWRLAGLLLAAGLAHLLLVLGVLMPMFSPASQHLMLSGDLGQLSRYGWLGHSFGDVLHTLLTRPLAVLSTVFLELGGGFYLLLLFFPLLLLPLAAPLWLLPGVADFAANLLSANAMPRSVAAYHSATLALVCVMAAIHGCRQALRWTGFLTAGQWAGLVLVSSVLFGWLNAPVALPLARDVWQQAHFPHAPDAGVARIRALVGDAASVSVQANIGAHFSQRRAVSLFPAQAGVADVVILRLESPTRRLLPATPDHVGTLAHHLQMVPADYLATVECLLADEAYGILLWDAPWLVLARNAGRDGARRDEVQDKEVQREDVQRADVRAAIATLRQAWPAGEGTLPGSCRGPAVAR